MCKCHRDAPEIPSDPLERKAMIQWLIEHPLWTHPSKPFKVPPENINIDPIDYMEGKITRITIRKHVFRVSVNSGKFSGLPMDMVAIWLTNQLQYHCIKGFKLAYVEIRIIAPIPETIIVC